MPDPEGNLKGEETSTPLHAYKDGREEDVEGAEETKDGNPEAAFGPPGRGAHRRLVAGRRRGGRHARPGDRACGCERDQRGLRP